jgi:excisionase family DNA binding protein
MSPTDAPALSDTWMTVSEAAALLGCSTRTVERRVARGELRRQERDGRVLVAVPDTLRRPADRMVEAVQEDAAQMRQLSAAVAQATEQAGIVLREAVVEAKAQAAAAVARALEAEQAARQARRVSVALACAVVGAVSVTVSVWVAVGQEAARSREEARQMSVTLSEAREQEVASRARATVLEERLDKALAERDGLGADILELEHRLRQATDNRPTPP